MQGIYSFGEINFII